MDPIHPSDRYLLTVLRDELWSCMESDLRQLAFSEGFSATTEAELVKHIKDLAVTVLHPCVHVVALHQMQQQEAETAKAFGARVKGTASNCTLVKTWPKTGCNQKVSYLEETCYHIVMSGLRDQDLKLKVLTQAMLNNVKDLPSLLNYVTAEESARAKTGVHDTSSGVRRQWPDCDIKKSKNCGNCGQPLHGDDNKERSSKCKV
jgi:hypothetical protein